MILVETSVPMSSEDHSSDIPVTDE